MPAAQTPPPSSLSRLRERAGVRAGVRVHARNLRTASTEAEHLLWFHLRNRRLDGFKFRRQHPVARFIADFACLEAGLIVELDGGQHFEPDAVEADQRRTRALEAAGFTVRRFDNRQMLQETEAVLASIRQWLLERHPHPSPLPQAGEGVSDPHPSPLPQAGEGVSDPHPSPLPQAGEGVSQSTSLPPLEGAVKPRSST